MTEFFEIFRAGDYPQGNVSAEQVQKIADNYDPTFLKAPITLDHVWGGPAYGWIAQLQAQGDRLLAAFDDVNDHLKAKVAKKEYQAHSVELTPNIGDGKDWYLTGLAMLGANIPQVKGMPPIKFSQEINKDSILQFDMDPGMPKLVERSQEEWREFSQAISQERDSFKADLDETKTAFEDLKGKYTEAEQKIETFETQIEEKDTRIAELEYEARKGEFASFLDELMSGDQPKITPALRDKALGMFEQLDKDGDARTAFQEFLKELPPAMNFKKTPEGKETEGSMNYKELAEKASEYVAAQAAKGNSISFTDAVDHVKTQSKTEQ